MPQRSKGARLYLYERKDREPQWIIRDGPRRLWAAPGDDRDTAEKHLAAYIANPKHYARQRNMRTISDGDAKFFIYFIEICADERPVKIGIAKDVKARLWNLGVGTPFDLNLLVALPGTLALERRLHVRLAGSRLRGEWFRRTAEVDEAIACAKSGDLAVFLGHETADSLRPIRKQSTEYGKNWALIFTQKYNEKQRLKMLVGAAGFEPATPTPPE